MYGIDLISNYISTGSKWGKASGGGLEGDAPDDISSFLDGNLPDSLDAAMYIPGNNVYVMIFGVCFVLSQQIASLVTTGLLSQCVPISELYGPKPLGGGQPKPN